jgi:hypothetical protein
MRPLILCLERLDRIRRVLKRAGGAMSVRDLMRSFAIWPWEIKQAAELGWLRVVARRPSGGGRLCRVAELCDERNAKLPKPRRQIEQVISHRYYAFAMRSVFQCCPRFGYTDR